MIKKSLLVLLVFALVAMQSLFIYALGHGAAEQYMSVWSSFGVAVPEYTRFIFRTANWWWAGPVLCLVLLVGALYRRSRTMAAATCILSVVLVVALYWSAYAPSLIVRL